MRRGATARWLVAVAAAAGCAGALAGPAAAVFPGINGQIAVGRNDQIVVKAPGDLTGGTALTSLGQNGDPEWSPDGRRIIFTSNRAGGVINVWLMNANGTNQTQLTSESADVSSPSWSPDGTRIAYTSSESGTEDIAVVAVAGGVQRVIVAGGSGFQSLPVWSPDGSRIIFQDETVNGLSSVGPTGAGRAPFLTDAAQPDFSPDAAKLIVQRNNGDLQVVNADGSGGLGVLQNRPGVRPVWSPDGTRILYHRLFMSGSVRLFTVASAGGGAETPESTLPGLDFSPDWQAIGPVPGITNLPVPLVAGTPGATLTVDGTGFVRRSVVRWDGTDRPTTYVSGTRLTAALTAADVAAPTSAQVSVFTSPSGGGASAETTATVAAAPVPPPPPLPPPRILLGAARLAGVSWARSRVHGTLRVTGMLERAGRVELALVRGKRVAQRRVLSLPAGAFTKRLALARTLLPGRYTLRLQEVGAITGAGLVAAQKQLTLVAPPEGVVSTSSISGLLNGPPARTLRHQSRLFAQFRFAALPSRKRRVTTTWIAPGGVAVNSDGKPRKRLVGAFISSSGVLPTGTWRCELRAGGRLVAVASVRLR